MSQFYFDPSRASDPHALPDAEVFYAPKGEWENDEGEPNEAGWYWQACFPGCMPDGGPEGPFESAGAAIKDAQEGYEP